MKKKLLTGLALGVFSVGLIAGSAGATSITYQDTINYFPGWNNTNNNTGDDLLDVIGTPAVNSMTITYNDTSRMLESVVVNMTGRRVFDSLFINADQASTQWDYMVRDNTGGDPGGAWAYTTWDSWLAQDGIYSVNSNYHYTLVPATATSDRENHPNGIAVGDMTFTGVNSDFITWDNATNLLTYNFASLTNFSITLGDTFAFAYAPWCANDVMITPEPASMLLFGAGLIGLAGIVTRRKKDEEQFLS